ncbi:type 1 glutamine amidotransferase [Catalinimonas alkaloidigena]|uniref:ThuA domain-containing protein n=1 Tax=Catalinimonas alkaloidigena TaxID=1075417 RepID=UPI0024060FD6|nr:ThuA domain-containing protein [Catalinimonas alkaloidigena]MDF9796675.1 type 1 glutamine amidotransferase [Catalinimonas alkaloidigena]
MNIRKILKISAFTVLSIALVAALGLGAFIYKVRYGFNFYETTAPELPADLKSPAVLLFSKTNGFRHGEAIEASRPAFRQIAKVNGWSLYDTDNGAVFNPEQLSRFEVVIWNNVSGKVLNEEQRQHFKAFLENGGGFVGIHAAGDNSHQWEWYENKVIGAHFSHHPIAPQIQEAELNLETNLSITDLSKDLPQSWLHADEWYMFYDNPRNNGAQVLYMLDESNINPSGNMGFLATDKDWGMGDDHPIVWYKTVGQGKAFYSALGHQGAAFQEEDYITLLGNAIRWAGDL